jgi:hypothetical protein
MNAVIQIMNGSTVFEPEVEDGISWSMERRGSPAKLIFKAVYDAALDIQEGNPVKLAIDGNNIFYGYIFKKSRDKDPFITVTAYDQLRYFKNKDTYMYEGKTASQLLRMICDDFSLKAGVIEDTKYVIPKKLEQNKTLFDIIQSALDASMMNTGILYCLYDNFGEITLKNIASMKVPVLIDAETGQNFEYESSIDAQTYNQVKLTFDNGDTGMRDIYMVKNSEHIQEWGVLQYYDTLQEGENGVEKANILLKYYDRKTRNLTLKDMWGDVRVRAGSAVLVRLSLGDMALNNFMVCESVTHTFNNEEHTMTLKMIGGEFIA